MKNPSDFFTGHWYSVKHPVDLCSLATCCSGLELPLFLRSQGDPWVSLTGVKQPGARKPQQNILGTAGTDFVYCSAPKDQLLMDSALIYESLGHQLPLLAWNLHLTTQPLYHLL